MRRSFIVTLLMLAALGAPLSAWAEAGLPAFTSTPAAGGGRPTA